MPSLAAVPRAEVLLPAMTNGSGLTADAGLLLEHSTCDPVCRGRAASMIGGRSHAVARGSPAETQPAKLRSGSTTPSQAVVTALGQLTSKEVETLQRALQQGQQQPAPPPGAAALEEGATLKGQTTALA